jgi:hypothetical protein
MPAPPIPTAQRRYRLRIPGGFYRRHSTKPGRVVRTDRSGRTSVRLTVDLTPSEIRTLAREAADATTGPDADAARTGAALLASLARTLREAGR